jgi:hypothetical protein
MQPNDLYGIIGLTVLMMAVVFGMLQMMLKLKGSRYDEEKKRIEIEIMRRTLEEKIYKDTDRLTANPERWAQVNHLLMEVLSKINEDSYIPKNRNNFFEASGINLKQQNVDKRKVFVLTPFHPRYEDTFRLISSACREVGLICTRGDEQYIQGGVLSHILNEITSAGIVIANIDGRNPNVFYELGIAHALGKNVIILASGLEDVPFDLRSQRLVLWNNPTELEKSLHQMLTRMLVEN